MSDRDTEQEIGREQVLPDTENAGDGEALTNLEVDEILGRENTEREGLGTLLNPQENPDYDPNEGLPQDAPVYYVRDPGSGRWILKRKPSGKSRKKRRAGTRTLDSDSNRELWDADTKDSPDPAASARETEDPDRYDWDRRNIVKGAEVLLSPEKSREEETGGSEGEQRPAGEDKKASFARLKETPAAETSKIAGNHPGDRHREGSARSRNRHGDRPEPVPAPDSCERKDPGNGRSWQEEVLQLREEIFRNIDRSDQNQREEADRRLIGEVVRRYGRDALSDPAFPSVSELSEEEMQSAYARERNGFLTAHREEVEAFLPGAQERAEHRWQEKIRIRLQSGTWKVMDAAREEGVSLSAEEAAASFAESRGFLRTCSQRESYLQTQLERELRKQFGRAADFLAGSEYLTIPASSENPESYLKTFLSNPDCLQKRKYTRHRDDTASATGDAGITERTPPGQKEPKPEPKPQAPEHPTAPEDTGISWEPSTGQRNGLYPDSCPKKCPTDEQETGESGRESEPRENPQVPDNPVPKTAKTLESGPAHEAAAIETLRDKVYRDLDGKDPEKLRETDRKFIAEVVRDYGLDSILDPMFPARSNLPLARIRQALEEEKRSFWEEDPEKLRTFVQVARDRAQKNWEEEMTAFLASEIRKEKERAAKEGKTLQEEEAARSVLSSASFQEKCRGREIFLQQAALSELEKTYGGEAAFLAGTNALAFPEEDAPGRLVRDFLHKKNQSLPFESSDRRGQTEETRGTTHSGRDAGIDPDRIQTLWQNACQALSEQSSEKERHTAVQSFFQQVLAEYGVQALSDPAVLSVCRMSPEEAAAIFQENATAFRRAHQEELPKVLAACRERGEAAWADHVQSAERSLAGAIREQALRQGNVPTDLELQKQVRSSPEYLTLLSAHDSYVRDASARALAEHYDANAYYLIGEEEQSGIPLDAAAIRRALQRKPQEDGAVKVEIHRTSGSEMADGVYGHARPGHAALAENLELLLGELREETPGEDPASLRKVRQRFVEETVARYGIFPLSDVGLRKELCLPEGDLRTAFSDAQAAFLRKEGKDAKRAIDEAVAKAKKEWILARNRKELQGAAGACAAAVRSREKLSLQEAAARYRKTPEWRAFCRSRTDFLRTQVSQTLAARYQYQAFFLRDLLKQRGVPLKEDAVEKTVQNALHFWSSRQDRPFSITDWLSRQSQSALRMVLDRGTNLLRSASGESEDPDAAILRRTAASAAANMLGLVGGLGALKAMGDCEIAAGNAKLAWQKFLSGAGVDAGGNPVLDAASSSDVTRFKSFRVIEKVIRGEDGKLRRVQISPLQALEALAREDSSSLPVSLMRQFSREGAAAVNARQFLLAKAKENPKRFLREDLAYLKKDGGRAFFSLSDASRNIRLLDGALGSLRDPRGLAALVRKAGTLPELERAMQVLRKQCSPEDPLLFLAEAKLEALKKQARLSRLALRGRALLAGILRLQGELFMTDENLREGTQRIAGSVKIPAGIYILDRAALRGMLSIRASFWKGRAGEMLMRHGVVFRLIGGERKEAYEIFRRGGTIDRALCTAATAPLRGAGKLSAVAAKAAVKGTSFAVTHAARAVKNAPAAAHFAENHPRVVRGTSAIYRGIQKGGKAAVSAGKGIGRAHRGVRGFLGRIAAPFRKTGAFLRGLRKRAMIALALVLAAVLLLSGIGLWAAYTASASKDVISTYSVGVMDHSKETLKSALDFAYERDLARMKKAQGILLGNPKDLGERCALAAPDFAQYENPSRGGIQTISRFGHPENQFANSIQSASEGYAERDFENIIYIRPTRVKDVSDFAAGSPVPIEEFRKFNDALRNDTAGAYPSQQSNAEEKIAIASAMFGNLNIRRHMDAYLALLKDLDTLMSPDERITAYSDLYANAYQGENDFIYFCNNRYAGSDGKAAYATDRARDYRGYFSSLAEAGGAVYSGDKGMLVGAFYPEEGPAEPDVDLLRATWHEKTDTNGDGTPESHAGCRFDQETYDANLQKWEEAKPDPSDFMTLDRDAYSNALRSWYQGGKTAPEPSRDEYQKLDDAAWQEALSRWRDNRPDPEDYYYCPGHRVTLCYGHRDAAVYILQYSMEDCLDDPDFLQKIRQSENYESYAGFIRPFEEDGGFQSKNAAYRNLASNFFRSDWSITYGTNIEEICDSALQIASSSGNYTIADDPYHLNEGDSAVVTTTDASREDLVRAAASFVGKISYYYGGKAVSRDFSENGFGRVITPDARGRNRRGLDCSGFVDFAYWQVGIRSVCRGAGTGGVGYLPVFYDASKLQPGDLGLHKRADAPGQGSANHIGIFAGFNREGQQVWIACGSHGVCRYVTSEFVVYYDVSPLFSE